MIPDLAMEEAHAEKPAPDWHECPCASCEKRRDLRDLADILMEADTCSGCQNPADACVCDQYSEPGVPLGDDK